MSLHLLSVEWKTIRGSIFGRHAMPMAQRKAEDHTTEKVPREKNEVSGGALESGPREVH